jgi:hypothetical protein
MRVTAPRLCAGVASGGAAIARATPRLGVAAHGCRTGASRLHEGPIGQPAPNYPDLWSGQMPTRGRRVRVSGVEADGAFEDMGRDVLEQLFRGGRDRLQCLERRLLIATQLHRDDVDRSAHRVALWLLDHWIPSLAPETGNVRIGLRRAEDAGATDECDLIRTRPGPPSETRDARPADSVEADDVVEHVERGHLQGLVRRSCASDEQVESLVDVAAGLDGDDPRRLMHHRAAPLQQRPVGHVCDRTSPRRLPDGRTE